MTSENRQYNKNRKILYTLHDYDPKEGTKDVHHIVFRSEGGTSTFKNLALIDKDLHHWCHALLDRIEGRNYHKKKRHHK